MLGNGGQDVHRQPVRVRHVGSDELNPAFHQRRDEGEVAGQAVELGDHHRLDGATAMHSRPSPCEAR
jgi:hypothetical protein